MMFDLIVTIWNTVPDAVRFVVADSPYGMAALELLAEIVNGTLFEDASIGN